MAAAEKTTYRALQAEEIRQLEAQGCTAGKWADVKVADPFLANRVRHVEFGGKASIGTLAGEIQSDKSPAKPCGIYNSTVRDCEIDASVRIANVHGHLAGYRIGKNVLIENVGVMETRPGARFGNGVEIVALNEAGGREVPLFNALSSQFAFLVAVYRYRGDLLKRLLEMAQREADGGAKDYGTVGDGARILGVPKIVDVNIGPAARIDSAHALVNGTVLSHADAPAIIGDAVIARDFIVAEGAQVTAGAIINHSFIGQGSRIGSQFSAENCLFFANCEAFHGEAVSVFAGPYTVTHHKSTLLIGGMFSFYNAGSGTNQSNHRYKLGPTHEGKLERGCKTGSFAYVMWPARVGPFSVVLGKHTRSFNTVDLPFSHLEADGNGRCELIPGHYIATVGTLRDGAKWPKRDRRTGPELRDVLCFEVFNPMTVGRLVAGAELLGNLQESTDRSVPSVTVGGAEIKRVLLRMGAKRYSAAVERYLLEQIFQRMERKLSKDRVHLKDAFAGDSNAIHSKEWLDIGGQLLPRDRFERIAGAVISGEIENVAQLQQAFVAARKWYEEDVWLWCRNQAEDSLGVYFNEMTVEKARDLAAQYSEQQQKFLRLVLIDAEREYDEASRIGFGMDGDADARDQDFAAVRGTFDDNGFVKQLRADIENVGNRCEAIQQRLQAIR